MLKHKEQKVEIFGDLAQAKYMLKLKQQYWKPEQSMEEYVFVFSRTRSKDFLF